MAGLLAAWVLFPLVALAVCLALGLLVERASGGRLPGALLLPVGMAGLIAVTQLPTYLDETAELTVPLVLVLALAGVVLGRERLSGLRPDPWAAAATFGVFAVLGAPVFLSGEATFAGYTVLGDTSIHMIGADALLEHGRDFASLPLSSYEYSLTAYYGQNGYPSGGPTGLAALTSLTGLDVAWSFQPFMTLLVAFAALALWSLLTPLVASVRLRAAIVFVSAQPALIMAYALQGSLKEIGTTFGVILIAATIGVWVEQARDSTRRILPLVAAAAATVGMVGLAAGVWIGPFALGAGLLALFREPRVPLRRVAEAALLAAVVGAVLTYQALADLATYVEVAGGVVTAQQEFGNLLGPLDWRQMFGIWLTGDYRMRPTANWLETRVLLGVAWIAIALGTWFLVRRRAWTVGLFAVVSLLAFAYVYRNGSPWADGKALVIVSPAVMLVAALGAAFLHRLRPAAGWALLSVLGAGVLASNAMAYHDVSNAPRERMAELQRIGERIDDEGPTLYTEFEEFAKHFIRQGAPEGSSEGWQRRFGVAVEGGLDLPLFGVTSDVDRFTAEYLLHYRTIVLRRGFFGSRPPSVYRRTFSGRFYDVWQRPAEAEGRVGERLLLGLDRTPAAVPDCSAVTALAEQAQPGDRLAYVERPPAPMFRPATGAFSERWFVDPNDAEVLRTPGQGSVRGTIEVPATGVYDLWVEGSFGRALHVRLDGREVGRVEHHVNPRQTALHVGTIRVTGGTHTIEVVSEGGDLKPGDGGLNRFLGPVVLEPHHVGTRPVRTAAPGDHEVICGRSLDWVEVLRP